MDSWTQGLTMHCFMNPHPANSTWHQSDLWFYEMIHRTICSFYLPKKAHKELLGVVICLQRAGRMERPVSVQHCSIQLLHTGQSEEDCEKQQRPLWVQLWIMGGTFLYLVTRYYGDKNSTNTSKRIRPRVSHSSLCSVVLPGSNLWWWIPLSWPFSYVAVLEYPLLGRKTTSDAILSSWLFIGSCQWTIEPLSYFPKSPCSAWSTVSLLYRTWIAGGVILLLNTHGSFIISFIQWWLEAPSKQYVLPKGMFNHHDCTEVGRLPPKPSSP